MHFFLPNIDRDRLRRLTLRGFVFLLIASAMLLQGSTRLMAGCHYGDGRSVHHAKQSDNPREHARNFSFLGQWVYERGEIKYVPWQGSGLCDGPNCQAEKPRPVSTGAPANSLQRLPVVVVTSSKSSAFSFDGHGDWLCQEDCAPLSGFVFEHEHPPKAM